MTHDGLARTSGAPTCSDWISRRFFRRLPVLAVLVTLFLLLANRQAQAVQPPYSPGLAGTWVNTQPTGLIAQVVIASGMGSFQAHLYGFCSPSTCDWGSYGASRFSDSVTSGSGVGFRLTISSSTDNKTVQGHLTGNGTLEITTQVSNLQSGSGNDYEVTEEFQLQGSSGGGAPNVPSNPPAITGTWTAVKSYGGLTRVIVTESGGALQIHPYGACSPTDCDWGVQPASAFSNNASSSSSVGLGASINEGFASRFLQGHLILGSTGETLLEITNQTTFAARDPRYDYELTEDFQLSTTVSPSFSINSASDSLTLANHGEASDLITIAPVNGSWDSAVQLSCSVSGASPAPTCSLSQPSVTPGSSSVTSTLTVKMPAVAAMNSKRLLGWLLYATMAPFALGVAFCGTSERGRKRWQVLFMLAVLGAVCVVLFACGAATSNNSNSPQAVGPYTVNVVANSGNIQLGTQITVTVQ